MIFTINKDPDKFHSIKNQTIGNESNLGYDNVPILEPHPGSGTVNVVNDFAWTKTRSIEDQHYKVPTIYLEEMYVTAPAMVSNLRRAYGSITGAVETILPQDLKDLITRSKEQTSEITTGNESIDEILSKWQGLGQYDTLDVNAEKNKYMTPYQDFYGVQKTNFRYRMPYFVDDYKQISNTFGPSILESIIDNKISKKLVGSISNFVTTGFGIDFAKIYNYKDDGPSTSFSFVLDNTFDSYRGNLSVPSFQQNWELIFLLLYQNLPGKLNSFLVQPPVIYSARVPGVFRYLYGYISALQVEAIGNRMEQTVIVSETERVAPKKNPGLPASLEGWSQAQIDAAMEPTIQGSPIGKQYKTLIPEAFKVNITLQSLLPETKNLFLYSLEDEMTTINIRKAGSRIVPDDRKLSEQEDLGDLYVDPQDSYNPYMAIRTSSELNDIENAYPFKSYEDVRVQGGGFDPMQSGG